VDHDGSIASSDAGPSDENRYYFHGSRSTSINRNMPYNVSTGYFFCRGSDLKEGTVMPVCFIGGRRVSRDPHFFPRSILLVRSRPPPVPQRKSFHRPIRAADVCDVCCIGGGRDGLCLRILGIQ